MESNNSNDPWVKYEKDLARYNDYRDSGINPLYLERPEPPTPAEPTTPKPTPAAAAAAKSTPAAAKSTPAAAKSTPAPVEQKPQKPQKDIRDAKSGEVWTAWWYIGDGKYDSQDYNITGVKNGQIHTNHKNESVINIGTIWKKKDAGTAGGKKTKKNKRTKTKKRKTNSKRKRRMKKTVSKR